jgi:hypothetical protein
VYRNGDFRAHVVAFERLDNVLTDMLSFPDFKNPNKPEDWVRFKVEFVAYLYKKFARRQIVGRPIDAFCLSSHDQFVAVACRWIDEFGGQGMATAYGVTGRRCYFFDGSPAQICGSNITNAETKSRERDVADPVPPNQRSPQSSLSVGWVHVGRQYRCSANECQNHLDRYDDEGCFTEAWQGGCLKQIRKLVRRSKSDQQLARLAGIGDLIQQVLTCVRIDRSRSVTFNDWHVVIRSHSIGSMLISLEAPHAVHS